MKDKLFYKIVKPIVSFLFHVLYRPTIIGIENIPKDGGVVLAGNHTKWLDPVMLVSINKRQVHFLAKKELFDGACRFIVKGMGCISVDRKKHDKNVLKNAYECLNANRIVGVFPEGTINRTGDVIMPFKIGAVKMSSETDSLLVPFVINGEYKLFRKGVVIEFLRPRKISKNLEDENEKLMEIVSKKIVSYKK